MADKLYENELIKRLVPNAGETPNLQVRIGWMGKSARNGYWRLYLTPELTEYIEFKAEDVVHTVSEESEDRPLAGTVVFLKTETELIRTCTTSNERQANWLRGNISKRNRRTAGVSDFLAPGGGPAGTIIWVTEYFDCFGTFFGESCGSNCPSEALGCSSQLGCPY